MDEKYKYIVCTSYVQYVACNEMLHAIYFMHLNQKSIAGVACN
jgi:hypothetical protein